MDFGEILSKAWKTVWKHKVLWIFGILAGCASSTGSSGGSGGGSSTLPSTNGNGGPPIMNPRNQPMLRDFIEFISEIPPWVWIAIAIGVLALLIVLSVIFLMLGTLGQAGVIKGTSMADEAEEDAKPLSLGDIFKGIKPYYWKVFLLNLGLRVGGFILTLLLAIPLFLFVVCTCCLGALLLIPIGWFIEVMIYFTTIAIIDEDKGIFEGIGRAWNVLIKNPGNVLVMFLILGIGQLIVGFILVLPIFLTFLPVLINLAVTGFESLTVGLIITLVLFLIVLPIVILLGGILKAYVLASWTLTYRRLTGDYGQTPTIITGEGPEEDEAPEIPDPDATETDEEPEV